MQKPSSFLEALRETARAAFNRTSPSPAEFLDLAKQCQFTTVLRLLEAYPERWDVRDERGNSLLHWAALAGNVNFIQFALSTRAIDVDVEAASSKQTPLMWAALQGHVETVQFLLDSKASLQAKDTLGATPFILATQHQRCNAIEVLRRQGGEHLLWETDEQGCTAVHWAAYCGDLRALQVLQPSQGVLQVRDRTGMQPLHLAVMEGHTHLISYLISCCSDPFCCDASGKSCLDVVQGLQDASMKKILFESVLGKLLQYLPEDRVCPASREDASTWRSLSAAVQTAPLAFGFASCRTASWPSEHGMDVAVEGITKSHQEQWIRHWNTCALAFNIEQFDSLLDALLSGLQKFDSDCRIDDNTIMCCSITDVQGAHMDVLSQCHSVRSPDCFPLTVRHLACFSVGSGFLDECKMVIDSHMTRRFRESLHSNSHCLFRIPPSCRWEIWKRLLRCANHMEEGAFQGLSERENKWTTLIANDVSRTFKALDSVQEKSLSRVLRAYAAHNSDLGYCQGMHLVAGFLLVISGCDKEDEAFLVLASLMDHLGIAGFYKDGLPLLRRYVAICTELLKTELPDLHDHFSKEGIEPAMYMERWFLGLFVTCLPAAVVLMLWDVIIVQGHQIMPHIVIALLTGLQEPLLSMNQQQIVAAFKAMGKYSETVGQFQAFQVGQILSDCILQASLHKHHIPSLEEWLAT